MYSSKTFGLKFKMNKASFSPQNLENFLIFMQVVAKSGEFL